MKHNYLIGIAMAGLMALPMQAQVNKFPAAWGKQKAQPGFALSQRQLKVPSAIDDKSRGVSVYGGERMDESKKRSFIKFKTNDNTKFTRIKHYVYKDEVNDQNFGIMMGASDGKDYYAFFGYSYTFSNMGHFFAKVNMQTGDTTVVRTLTTDERNAWYGDGVYGDYRNALYAMAYDEHSKTLFALGYGWAEDGSYGYTKLYAVDKETGEYDLVTEFDCIYYDFCFDCDGNMYATRLKAGDDGNTAVGTYLVKLDKDFDEVSNVEIKSEWGESYVMSQFGSLTIDNSTNKLYWMPATDYGATTLYTVDKETGICQYHSGFMMGNWFTGLYIPYLAADNRQAAARVAGIDALADVNGAMADTLKWTNPTTAWDGSNLESLKEVRIYRKKAGVATTDLTPTSELLSADNADLIATVPADGQMGKAMQYVDESPLQGINTYYVVPSRVAGEIGVPDSIRCYMGADVPGAVRNAYLEKQGEAIKITWEAPEKGLNNGYINPEELTYKITRLPDSVVVADDLKGNEFVDNSLGEQQKYYYKIQAKSKAGEGDVVETEGVMAGTALTTPINLTFHSYDDQNRWNTNVFGNTFAFAYSGWDGCEEEYNCLAGYTGYYDDNSTIVSPPLKLIGGKTYRIVSDIYNNQADSPFDVKVTMGRKSDDVSDASVLRDDKDLKYPAYTRTKYEDMFTAPEDGTYYYGLTIANHEYNMFRFYGLTVDYVADNDLKAFSIDNIIEAVAGQDNKCTVKVRNLGSNEQSKYAVKIYCNDEGEKTLVGETTDVPALKAGESADVPVTFCPTKDGKYDFYAVVELEGDEDESNNTSATKTINVLEEGSTAWSNIVTSGKDEGTDTHGPVIYYSTYDRTESVYYPSEINASNGSKITRIGYMYSSTLADRTDDSNVQIYMGYTDLNSYSSNSDAIDESALTLVYDGTMNLEPGQNNLLAFDLDTPFTYDNTKNLVVVVSRQGAVPTENMFCASFDVFNNNWSSGIYRSLQFFESYEYSAAKASRWPSAPVMYLAVSDMATGINSTKVVGGAFNYDSNSGVISLADGVKSAAVYTVDGKLVKSVGGKSQQLSLGKGIYVVSVKTADGKTVNSKLSVAK